MFWTSTFLTVTEKAASQFDYFLFLFYFHYSLSVQLKEQRLTLILILLLIQNMQLFSYFNIGSSECDCHHHVLVVKLCVILFSVDCLHWFPVLFWSPVSFLCLISLPALIVFTCSPLPCVYVVHASLRPRPLCLVRGNTAPATPAHTLFSGIVFLCLIFCQSVLFAPLKQFVFFLFVVIVCFAWTLPINWCCAV